LLEDQERNKYLELFELCQVLAVALSIDVAM
jgi:hypothetical protein